MARPEQQHLPRASGSRGAGAAPDTSLDGDRQDYLPLGQFTRPARPAARVGQASILGLIGVAVARRRGLELNVSRPAVAGIDFAHPALKLPGIRARARRRMTSETDMSAPQPEATGPDLTLGLATDTLADGKMLAGTRRRGRGPARAPRQRVLRDRRHLYALQRSARGRADGRRHRALPVAPRLLQPADRGSGCGRRRSVPSRAGRPSCAATRCSCGRKRRRHRAAASHPRPDGRRRS